MLRLPKSTEYNKRVVKKKFYEKLDVNSKLRNIFITQIQSVRWLYKIAPATINLAPGKTVSEIEIFEIKLTGPNLDKRILPLLDKGIPYHSLFLLEFEGRYQAWATYKEISVKGNSKICGYYSTGWEEESKLPLKLAGRDIDTVYENFLHQIAGEALTARKGETFKERVERDARSQKLQKRINALERKKRAEKQFNKRLEINSEIKKFKMELKGLQ